MKKPENKADQAYLLGKAAMRLKEITEIFSVLDRDSSELMEAAMKIYAQIDNGIVDLGLSVKPDVMKYAFKQRKDTQDQEDTED